MLKLLLNLNNALALHKKYSASLDASTNQYKSQNYLLETEVITNTENVPKEARIMLNYGNMHLDIIISAGNKNACFNPSKIQFLTT